MEGGRLSERSRPSPRGHDLPQLRRVDELLLTRSDYDNHWQAFNIAKSVARFSLGLSKKDETSRLIERLVERVGQTSSNGFFDDCGPGFGGNYSLYGVMTFIFVRQALQLHANAGVRERKLPTLRTIAERYVKMLPDLVRTDGLGWAHGRSAGAYGQMHCISIVLQAFRDGWIPEDQKARYFDILRRLFYFLFSTYLDQEHGFLLIRDSERTAMEGHNTRMANFDGARYLSQWSRLAKNLNAPESLKTEPQRTSGRFVIYDKSNRKEQGLFLYRDADSGLHIQLPLVSSGGTPTADSLPFPHAPGIFDWPTDVYLPVLIPELTFGSQVTIPAYYGKRCVTGLGLRNSFFFRYEQPELITKDEALVNGLGSVKVTWAFAGNKVNGDFIYTVKSQVQLDKFRFAIVIAAPHSHQRLGISPMLGQEGLRCTVVKDDFQGNWREAEVVTEDPAYRTNYGKVHYVQFLERDHPLIMRPGSQYRFSVNFEPDITLIEA
jgi:hypothetical protein